MPASPAGAGNRRRLVATCDFLESAGFDVDFALLAHEDQIYRRFDQHPPTDLAAMAARFRRVHLIEFAAPIRLRTGARAFDVDDWCPPELDRFVRLYCERTPEARAVLVNYVWLSRALEAVPDDRLRLLDTHDGFADRKAQYHRFRAEANFFHTDAAGEARGLRRADLAIAIQAEEKAAFEAATGREVALLPPRFDVVGGFVAPKALARIGFLGHGNDANLHSIGRFIAAWTAVWREGMPTLVVAGEICRALPADPGRGVVVRGYVERIGDFYDEVDLVVAPMLLGTGLKMKVVEALAHGVPVIGTPVAFEGIASDLAEHRFASLEAMIARIGELAGDAAALARLTTACERVYADYRALADRSADALARRLADHRGGVLPASPPIAPQVETAETAETARTTDGVVIETISARSLPDRSEADEPLVATEFLPFDPADPATASPLRRRWYLAATASAGATRTGPNLLAGRRLALSPLLTAAPGTPAAARSAVVAVGALVEAEPDWSSTSERFAVGGRMVRISFRGPGFLLRPTTPMRVFLLDDAGRAVELVAPKATRRIAPDRSSGVEPVLSRRCGDTPLTALTVVAGVPADGGAIEGMRRAVIVAHALWGRVEFGAPAAATATGVR